MFGEKRELITKQCCVCKKMTSAERELLISAVCGDCWPLLCSSNPLDYN
jgi:hypothetical protein